MTEGAHLRKPSADARYCCKTCNVVVKKAAREITRAAIATTSVEGIATMRTVSLEIEYSMILTQEEQFEGFEATVIEMVGASCNVGSGRLSACNNDQWTWYQALDIKEAARGKV